MSTTVEAVYENGKLVLERPLPLPEKSHVLVTIQTEEQTMSDEERQAWLRLAEQSLMRTWDNAADDVFNELLQK